MSDQLDTAPEFDDSIPAEPTAPVESDPAPAPAQPAEPDKNEMPEGKTDTDKAKKAAIPEAGGVAWIDLYGQKTVDGVAQEVKISLTARAVTSEEALRELLHTMVVAEKEFKLKPYRVQKQAPPMQQAPAQAPAPAGTATPASPPPAPAGKPEPHYEDIPGQGTGTLLAIRMVVIPRPAEGKAKLEFYGAGRQYPDVTAVLTYDQLAGLLAPVGAWTPAHFMTAADYQVKYAINWRESDKRNKSGNPYKNIVGINPG